VRVVPDLAGRAAPPECVAPGVDDAADAGVVLHRVSQGETLTSIARDAYGDEALWSELARANPGIVGAEGGVQTGALIVIPFEGR